MPPVSPYIGLIEKRQNRLSIPKAVCPGWVRDDVEVMFLPLSWRNEDLWLSDIRLLEVMLICQLSLEELPGEWNKSPTKILSGADRLAKPEIQRDVSLIYKSKLEDHNRGWRLNCPPMMKGLCDNERRVYVTDHSLGVCVWSPPAFQEHHSQP